MSKKHLIVIGAGMVGLSCALHLQKRGHRVTLIDKRGFGNGSSNHNACILSVSSVIPVATPGLIKQIPKYLTMRNSPLIIRYGYFPRVMPWLLRFLWAGRHSNMQKTSTLLKSLQKDTLGEHERLTEDHAAKNYVARKELLYVYTDRQAFLNEAYFWDTRRRNGVVFHEVEEKQLRELEPDISDTFRFAVSVPDHGYITDTSKYLRALGEKFMEQGGNLIEDEVRRIDPGNNKVNCGQGEHAADGIVLAGGVWSAALAKQLGDTVPLESEGGYYIDLPDPGISLSHPMLNLKFKMGITPIETGIRFAGLVEFGGLDCPENLDVCDVLVAAAKIMYPAIRLDGMTRHRGQRPSTVDSLPVIGRASRHENIYYAFGHQHVGLSTGPVTGRLIAELIDGEATSVDIAPFSAKRFR